MRAHGRPNILFSTTRSWNCGDDFILFGVRNLLSCRVPSFNAIIYNRHPELHYVRARLNKTVHLKDQNSSQEVDLNLHQVMDRVVPKFDNSLRPDLDLSGIDAVVFAGTPEWFGTMVRPVVDGIAKRTLPVAYLGLGSYEKIAELSYEQIPEQDRNSLEAALVVTVREGNAARLLAPLSPQVLPCPALFAAERARHRQGPGSNGKLKIALSLQGCAETNGQRMEKPAFDFARTLFAKLVQRHDCQLVCHYIEDLTELQTIFGDTTEVLYAYDPKDYFDLYDTFDLTVTTRVHGAGLCASLGIPSVVLGHSARSSTTDGFLSEVIDPATATLDEALACVENLVIAERSAALITHKRESQDAYLASLGPFLHSLKAHG